MKRRLTSLSVGITLVFVLVMALAACMAQPAGQAPDGGPASGSGIAPGSAIASDSPQDAGAENGSDTVSGSDAVIGKLFEEQRSAVQVEGSGTVTRLLEDDNTGDRHQRFILELTSGQTLLVAHNIDIAPRLDGLAVGDTVAFYGEYVYSDKGGTIHWTHRDPGGRHVAGWLKWNGKKYQ